MATFFNYHSPLTSRHYAILAYYQDEIIIEMPFSPMVSESLRDAGYEHDKLNRYFKKTIPGLSSMSEEQRQALLNQETALAAAIFDGYLVECAHPYVKERERKRLAAFLQKKHPAVTSIIDHAAPMPVRFWFTERAKTLNCHNIVANVDAKGRVTCSIQPSSPFLSTSRINTITADKAPKGQFYFYVEAEGLLHPFCRVPGLQWERLS